MDRNSILKQVRIEKSLTLEQIAHILKIKVRFLKQIEDNNNIELNDPNLLVYYKKAYARFLGVNIKLTLDDNIEHTITRTTTPAFSLYFTILSSIALYLLLC